MLTENSKNNKNQPKTEPNTICWTTIHDLFLKAKMHFCNCSICGSQHMVCALLRLQRSLQSSLVRLHYAISFPPALYLDWHEQICLCLPLPSVYTLHCRAWVVWHFSLRNFWFSSPSYDFLCTWLAWFQLLQFQLSASWPSWVTVGICHVKKTFPKNVGSLRMTSPLATYCIGFLWTNQPCYENA